MKKSKRFLVISLVLFTCLITLSGCSQINLTGVNSAATPGAGLNGTPPEGMTFPDDGGTPPEGMAPSDGGTPPSGASVPAGGPAN